MLFKKRSVAMACCVALFSVICFVGWSYAQREGNRVPPEKLLPARSIIFLKVNGSLLTDAAFKKTASYQALYASGLMQVIENTIDALPTELPNQGEIEEALDHLEANGLSLSISDGQGMQPWGLIVVHDAVGGAEFVNQLLESLPDLPLDIQEVTRQGRSISMTMIPNSPVELGWWEEQGHLVIAVGIDAIRSAISVAEGQQPNLTESPLYEKYLKSAPEFTVNQIGWFDFGSLQKMYGGIPLPLPTGEQVSIDQLLQAVGLNSLDHVAVLNGYKGEANWSEQVVSVSGETAGLMQLGMQNKITLQDLPPIPVGQTSIAVASFDWSLAYASVWQTIQNLAEYAPPVFLNGLNAAIDEFERELGFRPEEFFATLGNVHCIYTDKNQGLFGLGGAVVVSVKDAERLRGLLNDIAEFAEQESRGDFTTSSHEKHGRTVTLLEFPKAPVFTPTICVDQDWLIVGLVPQAVEAFLLRMDGKLPVWEPSIEHQRAIADLPKEFTSLTIIDPQDTYRFLLGFAPLAVGGIEMALREAGTVPEDFRLPVSALDIPPSEVILAPLFPNVMMTTVDANGIHSYSRQSLPGIPLIGGADGTTTVASSAVLIALLLPAVQQAREAARRTQSKNNIKQIMLAIHNYHDTYNYCPQGTIPNAALDPEERLSWLVSILPYIEQGNLHNQIDQKQGWESDFNAAVISQKISIYQHPNNPVDEVNGYGTTSYLGVAGVGENGPTLPVNHPKAGMFGYDRVTRFRDVQDGLSNTIMVGEAESPQPWGAGGKSTILPLTKQPYINGGNGYGSRSVGGAHFGLADGSVRFVSENIDPEVLEALSTIRGREVIGGF